ncbi:uncharacterized protein LOC125497546 isoform X2 [Beta vulgaris subsp. vulgaris]|uniref:uncharacterized protein LOC125497546 isoform X2 n=1 Tax=Beta vulgaris subsp. vulgaris TaxID=3555 RepID=UPI002037665B|nr:uncharacterized protein LOC125497546 isoform X2 [Beta vulgaris subsp. vulgaris]
MERESAKEMLIKARLAQLAETNESAAIVAIKPKSKPLHIKEKQFSKMSPSSLMKFIDSGLSFEQKRDVESIGFGGLLHLKTNELPSDLCRWLLHHFNPYSSSLVFYEKQLAIELEDFYLVFGLPKIGEKIVESGSRDNDELLVNYLEHLGKTRNELRIKDIIDKMKEQKSGGENFKRNFVMLVVSTLFRSNQKGNPQLKILKCLRNVDLISKFNWCQYGIECLTDSKREWVGSSMFTGPILALMLCYMDRVSFMGRSIERKFPLLSCWRREDIFYRRDFELTMAGDFGTGVVKPRLVIERNAQENISLGQEHDTKGDSKKACIFTRLEIFCAYKSR